MLLRTLFFACLTSLLTLAACAADKPLQVFVLCGQSNMQGHAQIRTLEHIGMDPATKPLLLEMQNEKGEPRVCKDVWISYLSSKGEKHGQLTAGFGADDNKIGPELTFGIYMQKLVGEPILIIKTAWGGKSLHTDFRSPSAGPYVFNESQIQQIKKQGKDLDAIKAEREKATGHYYRLTLEHVNKVLSDIKRVYPNYDSDQGYELAGFVWFQGWNDMVDRGVYPKRDKPGGYDRYSEALSHFIRDIRKDLKTPGLPFVIGVMGTGGPVAKYTPEKMRYAAIHQNFRDAMAAPSKLPEFLGNVAPVLTENYWDMELAALRARDAKVKQEIKKLVSDGKLEKKNERATQERYRAEEFTERELEILQKGVSNFEFHYLGCGKIMAQIGKGFAEKMFELSAKK